MCELLSQFRPGAFLLMLSLCLRSGNVVNLLCIFMFIYLFVFCRGTRGIVLPQLSFGYLSVLSEWCGGMMLAVKGYLRLVTS